MSLLTRIKEIPEDKRASWRFHVVRAGETLDGIATALACPCQRDRRRRTASLPDDSAGRRAMSWSFPLRRAGAARIRSATRCVAATRWSRLRIVSASRWKSCGAGIICRRTQSKPGRSLTVAEPVKLAPGTHVRGKTLAQQKSSHVAARHAASSHAKTKPCDVEASQRDVFDDNEENVVDEAEIVAPNRNRKLHDKLPHEKDCLPSLALGCILLLESRARM